MTRLVVISGPANTGKMPLARKLMAEDHTLVCVHRDSIRDALIRKIDEGEITHLLGVLADKLLGYGHSVIVVAWNLETSDRYLWTSIADERGVPLEWLDVRDPIVTAMIPPMQVAA